MSFTKEKLEQKFKDEYERLNEQQRLAVDKIEGPVMVIAGPGTGKTQILAARIGKILLETDTSPANILCLTYTEAGTIAMRRRLQHFIGPDAYKVNIYTFHAFCNDVIQENLSLFEKTSMDPVSDLEETEIFKELIDSFPGNHPLKRFRGDVYFEINNLKNLFSAMKREGWTPEFVSRKIDEFLNLVENSEAGSKYYKEYKYQKKYRDKEAGSLKPAFEELKEKMEKLRAAANEFPRFQQLMHKRNRYDFDDMINWVIKAFRENKNLLARYQEQFQYILVDEFQDSSGTQNKIVELLISYWDKPNIFVVGDDDQSIFRFQGANVENMLNFADSYKNDLLTVVLTSNYRSTQPILDISKTLIDQNQERLVRQIEGLSKNLLSANPAVSQSEVRPILKEYETQREEMTDIILQVEKLIQQGTVPKRIAVIYKENKFGNELMQYCKLRKIPFYSRRNQNIFEIPLARKIILLLQYLAAEHDIPYGGDEMLFEILHFDWFQIPAMEVAKISVEVAERQFGKDKTSIRELIYEKSRAPAKDLFSQGLHAGLLKAHAVLEKLISDVPNVTIQQLLENIIRETGILQYIMQSPEKVWLIQVLTAVFDFVKEESRRDPSLQLQGLVSIFELMEKEGIPLPIIQVSGNDRGVNLLTVHGSKGLEFEYVFFAGCNAGFWEGKRAPSSGYKLPDTFFPSLLAEERGDSNPALHKKDAEELRRLFYVALTRAEKYLYISYSRYGNDGKEREPSMFIAEILAKHDYPVEKVFISEEVLAEFQLLQFGEVIAPEIEKLEEEFIGRLLEKFVMNVTALNNYLNCPLEFYFKTLVRIPSPKNEATEFGSSVHYALEKLFRKMLDSEKKQFPSRETFIGDFEWYMKRHRESFTKEQFNRRMEYGIDVLGKYYDQYINSWHRVVSVERSIKGVVVNGVPLKGKLDKLEFFGEEINVVDYKTGDPEKSRSKLQSPNEKNPEGGDYWRQAVFYKILVDQADQKGRTVRSAEFDFVEPDKKKKYKKERVLINEADIETVREQISSVWTRIQNREFYTGCGKPDCHWCNFAKTNNLAVALHEVNEEEESES
jgi:DNA helicase-2/ATP-dependent DNA helicase PcrA